jgi:hypothetical protein
MPALDPLAASLVIEHAARSSAPNGLNVARREQYCEARGSLQHELLLP